MFYIRTADRLQRTSVWRDNLEGGLDYLKQVVCQDKLGIGAELEADMRRVIDSYECEWKKVIGDPVHCGVFVTTSTAIVRIAMSPSSMSATTRPARPAERHCSRRRFERRGRSASRGILARSLRARGYPAAERRRGADRWEGGRGVPSARCRVPIGNHDPASDANVLSRASSAILAEKSWSPSPIYKQHSV